MPIQERFGVPLFCRNRPAGFELFFVTPGFRFRESAIPLPPMKATPGLVTWQHPMNIYTPSTETEKITHY